MGKRFLSRVRILTLACILVALIIIGRLYLLQIIHGPAYTQRAEAQFADPQNPLLDRGTIYFTTNTGTLVTAATMEQGYSLAVNPTKVTNPLALYSAIASTTPLSYAEFLAKATKSGSSYESIANHIEGDPAVLISKQLPGLIISDDSWRYYPGGSLAAQEIGFVAYDNDNVETGQYGLEKQYNTTLARDDTNLYGNFFVELFGGLKSVLSGAPQEGDIVTTIEPNVQAELERDLAQYSNQWHPKFDGGIIMNPQTGAIYAMAMNPTFDLNAFNTQTDPLIYANPLVQNVYEMGSVVKALTMAAGIDSGAVTENETYNDTGCITVSGDKVCNFDFKARGVIPMQQILTQSLNVGAAFVATQMGSSTMRNYFVNRFDLGEPTGIDLPGEVSGILSNLSKPPPIDDDTASFGQGIAQTPLEIMRALAVIPNGGYLVTPHLVSAIRYTTGVTQTLNWPKVGPVIQPATATTLQQMLTNVVNEAGVDHIVQVPGYNIAAKTGTAQIPNPNGGGYIPNEYIHTYIGFLPSLNNSAQFIIFLIAYDPGAELSVETWPPEFEDLSHFLINYYKIPPSS
jgi:cell division protein FtsI/penicillin-binding protein 2